MHSTIINIVLYFTSTLPVIPLKEEDDIPMIEEDSLLLLFNVC